MRALRYASGICAVLFGILEGCIAISQTWLAFHGVTFGLYLYLHIFLALLSNVSGSMVLFGAPVRIVTISMGVAVISQVHSIWFMVPSMIQGVWMYSSLDVLPISLAALSLFALVTSMIADNYWQSVLTFLRRTPYQEVE